MLIKLIVSDMDGTLLGKDHDISEENLKAIRAAKAIGIKFAIATGRAYEDVEPFLKKYSLNCECIVQNGAEYRNEKGEVLQGIYIEKSKVKDILALMNRDGFRSEIYTDRGFYTTSSREDTLKSLAYRVQAFDPQITDFEEALEKAKENNHFINLSYIDNIDEFINSEVKIGKFVAFSSSEEKITLLKKEFEKISGLAVSSSFKTNIEINHIDAQKGLILKKVVQKFGYKEEEVLVLGDSFNDMSMFKEFTNSVAMGNAIDEIKAVAKYETDTNDKAGVAKAIHKILNI